MNDQNNLFLLKREFFRLVDEFEQCQIHTIKYEIKKDILLLQEALDRYAIYDEKTGET
ncbi:hypothetical protein [Priestia megaterium]|jgi:hypothetical protein|uniref:Uncharacterized protein n=1 Tax=Priestia megaterium TaxID=1404 RepID=A0ABD4WXD5_PRIMG|nr:hypothetical protein [Priestia megaterium]MCF6800056.1 hypothetical protein [Bacillus sp. ET1]MDD9784611.1 hypothetical protein [Priestia megaterium]MDR7207402.1 hypothetical protein [Priestia megaterium]MED3860730.1 hypothetical protein [Priestia megaterium]MED4234906.1 hypothetical protein [Priestia megaterium]